MIESPRFSRIQLRNVSQHLRTQAQVLVGLPIPPQGGFVTSGRGDEFPGHARHLCFSEWLKVGEAYQVGKIPTGRRIGFRGRTSRRRCREYSKRHQYSSVYECLSSCHKRRLELLVAAPFFIDGARGTQRGLSGIMVTAGYAAVCGASTGSRHKNP